MKKITEYSGTQTYLLRILDDYSSEFFDASNEVGRENVRNRYLGRLKHFLVDSLGRYIDSISVVVDTVIKQGWFITTHFHTGEIEFRYGMKFQENMAPSFDSLYRFMTSLSPGNEITADFIHLGSVILNNPDDTSKRTLTIFAYPSPLRQPGEGEVNGRMPQ